MSKFLTAFLVLLVVSCSDSNTIYHEYQVIEGSVWTMRDSRSFEFEVDDLNATHNLYLGLRNSSDYGYHNLYVFVTMTLPDGAEVTDTVHCPIADPTTGKWYGSGIGDLWDNLIMFKQNAKFPQLGTYKFTLTQGMREDLSGISDVGFKVEKANN